MKREDKVDLFRDLLTTLEDEDIQVLADVLIENGKAEYLQQAIDLAEVEEVVLDETKDEGPNGG